MPSNAQMSEMHGEGYIVGQIFLKINERATPQKMEKEKIKKERRRKETGERKRLGMGKKKKVMLYILMTWQLPPWMLC